MLRATTPFLVATFAIAIVAGGLYGTGVIGVLAVYGLTVLAGLITAVGYVRWDAREHQQHR